MVKLSPLTVPPVEVEVAEPVDDVDAAGVGPPVVVFDVTLLLLVVAPGVGPPVVVLDGVPFTVVVAAGTGTGPPVEDVVVEPLVLVVAAGTGVGPPTVLLPGVPFTIDVAALFPVVLQAPPGASAKVGPLVLAPNVGAAAAPSVVTTVLL